MECTCGNKWRLAYNSACARVLIRDVGNSISLLANKLLMKTLYQIPGNNFLDMYMFKYMQS